MTVITKSSSLASECAVDEKLICSNCPDGASGFGNRFLWACVRRSKELPEGGCVPESELERVGNRLKHAFEYARSIRQLCRNEEDRAMWHSKYKELSEGKQGLFGAIVSRGEAQVMRMACLYALLD
jgi:hypothetical protein